MLRSSFSCKIVAYALISSFKKKKFKVACALILLKYFLDDGEPENLNFIQNSFDNGKNYFKVLNNVKTYRFDPLRPYSDL